MASKKGGKVKKPTLVEKLKAMRQEYKEATKKLRANETDEEREFRRKAQLPFTRGLKAGGAIKKKPKKTFVDKFREDMPLGIGKILTPIESSGVGGAYKRMTKGLGEKIVSKYNKISTKKPVKKNAGGMIKAYKKGGAVKKKSIDGIAMRGKTKVKRVKG